MKIAIYGSRHQDAYLDILRDFLLQLARENAEVVMHPKLYNYLIRCIPGAMASVRRVMEQLDCNVDLVLSIGGDGTFLRTVQWTDSRPLPILGVNTGHLGFLTAIGIDELPRLLDEYRAGAFISEQRSLLQVVEPQLPFCRYALNEITVAKDANASMIRACTHVGGHRLCDYRADGLIVATPTGSTAYAMSVGGPIIAPDTPAFVLAPIAAHSLSMRPLVVGDASRIDIEVQGRADRFRLSVDGRSVSLAMGTGISVVKAPYTVSVLRHRDRGFAAVLNSKLGWE
ncbi:MAG: NAD(+)/NADH kinase [Muribaculaceae bacterium]|nr:NAD(+)/NADH kinase [Muribaculaceae bacterium]